MSDPLIVRVQDGQGVDPYDLAEILNEAQKWLRESLPPKFAEAVVSDPVVRQWVCDLVAGALGGMRSGYPVVLEGPSLVLSGKPGRGKSWQAWGAVRALSVSGVRCRWAVTGASKLLSSLRPRHGVDSELVFEELESVPLLVIDDMGATKGSAWSDEVFDRLVNTRDEWGRPTLITTNVPPKLFEEQFGDRIASRLMGMATVVPFTGPDLRRQRGVS